MDDPMKAILAGIKEQMQGLGYRPDKIVLWVADDDRDFIDELKRTAPDNVNVRGIYNKEDLMMAVRENGKNILLMDIDLAGAFGGADGFDLIKEMNLTEWTDDLVVCSGNDNPRFANEAVSLGGRFLSKDEPDLLSKIV